MNGSSTLGAGFAALGRGRMILLLAGTSILLGLLAASPLGPALHDKVAGTLAGDHFLRNDPELAPSELFDFLREEAPAVKGATRAAWCAAALGLLLQIFYAGGIVETVGRYSTASVDPRAAFWAGARRHFAHNVKCFLLFAAAVGIVETIWLFAGFGAHHAIFRSAPPHAPGRTATLWLVVLVAAVLFGILTIVYDFARASRRVSLSLGAMAAAREARRRLRGRWLAGLGLLAFWSLAGALSVGLLFAAAWSQRTPSAAAVAVNLVLLALLLTSRSAVRVGAWGSILALFDASTPPLLPPPAPVIFTTPVEAPVPVETIEPVLPAPAPPPVEPIDPPTE